MNNMAAKNRYRIVPLVMLVLAGLGSGANAAAPYTLAELYTPPWPFGSTPRSLTLSDDGRYVACGFDWEAEAHRDLWIYDSTGDAWFQLTRLWEEREARLRREFAVELDQARQDHLEEQEKQQEDSDESSESDSGEFDAELRNEEFEKDLKKQRDSFRGISQAMFLRGSHELLYLFEGAVYSVSLRLPDWETSLRLQHEAGFSGMFQPRDANLVVLESGSDFVLWNPINGALRQLTDGGHGDRPNTSGYAVNNDASLLAYATRDFAGTRQTKMADLLEEDPQMTSHRYIRPGDTLEKVSLTIADLSVDPAWTYNVELEEEPYYQIESIEFSPLSGDNRLLLGLITEDTEYYRAYLIQHPASDLEQSSVELIYEEHDPAWINWGRTHVAWAYDGRLFLQSEKCGVAGIYELAPVECNLTDATPEATVPAMTAVPVLAGGEEISRIQPLLNSPEIVFLTDFGGHTSQGIGVINIDTLDKRYLTEPEMWSGTDFTLSFSENRACHIAANDRTTGWLSLTDLAGQDTEILAWGDEDWHAWADSWRIEYLTVPTRQFDSLDNVYRGGEVVTYGEIHCKLHLPPSFDPAGSYPLLIWAHGAGYAQTVSRTASFYTHFHPWLAHDLGWIVAEVDYRGSEGYGRDWRTDVASRLGHPEVEDLVAVKHHLVDNYGADPQRTALWGWSYGGFLTLMAAGLAPGEFTVGCAVAPVNRWENYYYWYSTCRLGQPGDNPEAYDRSAAETYLDQVGDDLLILHGLRDDNTLFQSVAQYLEKSHEHGASIELKLFPSDDHGIGNEFHYVRVFEAIVDYCQDHWK